MINAKLRVLEVSNAHLKVICKLLELGMKYCCLGKRVQSINSINKSSWERGVIKKHIHENKTNLDQDLNFRDQMLNHVF